MIKSFILLTTLLSGVALKAVAQVSTFKPVTKEMLLNPSPNDWLMFSRTYDSQRFSPLNQINRSNIGQLRMVWSRGMVPGEHENIPLVHDGVMYVVNPQATVQALDATNGDLIWEYKRTLPKDLGEFISRAGRNRTLSIYEDLVFFAAPDGFIVALDARTGKLRWETKTQDYKNGTQHTAGAIVVDGKVLSGRGCSGAIETLKRSECSFIVAHDALTGKEAWRFYTTAAPNEPGGDTWGNTPEERRQASPWGLPGSFDPLLKLVYWGIANPKPHTRWARHNGIVDDIPQAAPAELYSNSTVALDVASGKLKWYYQELPGDDWDMDHTHERILIRTRINPDPSAVKWISSRINRGQERDVVVSIGDPGGIWVVDRGTGQFQWATPFPFDTPYFHVSKVDSETGKSYINWDQVMKTKDDKNIVCYSNQRSYAALAYSPKTNSLYAPYLDVCFQRTFNDGREDMHQRITIPRPGSDPNAPSGLMKIDMATGQTQKLFTSKMENRGAMLVTAGDLLFWGDWSRRLRAFDAESGKILWETILAGNVENSTITYAVNGKQYVAVLTGDGTGKGPGSTASIYAFALP